MKKVIEVFLKETDDNTIYKIFDKRFEKSKSPYKFYVRSLAGGYPNFQTPKGFLNQFAPGWVVRIKNNNSTIGEINREVISDKVLLSFELENTSHRKDFLELANSIIFEVRFLGGNLVNKRLYTPEGTLQEDAKVKPPKQKDALVKHQKAWKIVKNMKKDNELDYENSAVDEVVKITIAEFRDRVNNVLKTSYGEKTISRIINEGEAGLLD